MHITKLSVILFPSANFQVTCVCIISNKAFQFFMLLTRYTRDNMIIVQLGRHMNWNNNKKKNGKYYTIRCVAYIVKHFIEQKKNTFESY